MIKPKRQNDRLIPPGAMNDLAASALSPQARARKDDRSADGRWNLWL